MTTVKMCDMPREIVIKAFKMLNGDNVELKERSGIFGTVIITDIEPKDLVYPEGWYYAKGALRNKHTSTNGFYEEIRMETSDGESWADKGANYCTLYLE